MRIFFDTSSLVAASQEGHPHYAQARPALVRVVRGEDQGLISAHSIAETYAALTRLPVWPRIQPMEADRILSENILPYFEVLRLETRDYRAALSALAAGGWAGGKIYDALLLECASRADVERLYTFNLADFRQLAPNEMRDKICAP